MSFLKHPVKKMFPKSKRYLDEEAEQPPSQQPYITTGEKVRVALRDLVEVDENSVVPTQDQQQAANPTQRYGTFNGVFVRAVVSIFSVIMFLRINWMIGNAGLGQSLLVLLICAYITVTTTFSLSALCTNGKVAAGGPYYLVSRSVGIEFGQMVGIIFSIAQMVAIALNTVGFAEEVVKFYDTPFTKHAEWDMVVISIVATIISLIITIFGVSLVNKANLILFGGIMVGFLGFLIGTWARKPDLSFGFTGYSGDTFKDNFGPSYAAHVSFITVLGVFFPCQYRNFGRCQHDRRIEKTRSERTSWNSFCNSIHQFHLSLFDVRLCFCRTKTFLARHSWTHFYGGSGDLGTIGSRWNLLYCILKRTGFDHGRTPYLERHIERWTFSTIEIYDCYQ
jgi:hypothetical protein